MRPYAMAVVDGHGARGTSARLGGINRLRPYVPRRASGWDVREREREHTATLSQFAPCLQARHVPTSGKRPVVKAAERTTVRHVQNLSCGAQGWREGVTVVQADGVGSM
jgi:hypothetical protein